MAAAPHEGAHGPAAPASLWVGPECTAWVACVAPSLPKPQLLPVITRLQPSASQTELQAMESSPPRMWLCDGFRFAPWSLVSLKAEPSLHRNVMGEATKVHRGKRFMSFAAIKGELSIILEEPWTQNRFM